MVRAAPARVERNFTVFLLDLFPIFKYFAKGSQVGDEPRRAAIFTFVLSQCVLFMGSIDVVAAIITAIFCLSYALINLTCFFLSVTGGLLT